MGSFFVHIYDFFDRCKGVFRLTLGLVTAALLFFALKVRYSEQVTNFFSDEGDGSRQTLVFENLKAKDKIVVMFSSDDPDLSIECAAEFETCFMAAAGDGYVRSVTSEVDSEQVGRTVELIYGNLPAYISPDDYARIDSLLAGDAIDRSIADSRTRLASPMGMALRDIILQDPLGIATGKFAALQNFSSMTDYEIYGGHIFSADMSVMMMVIEPEYGMGDTGANEVLVSAIERAAQETAAEGYGEVEIEYFGGPSVAVWNARRIKADTILTLSLALVVIVAFIFAVFRNRWAILLIMTPVVFGAIFALAVIWLTGQESISAIAVGAGAAVLGIALSYSIHVISHSNHTHDPRRIIRELAYPLTVGSITTIGAFLGLLFTKSQLLRDFGLFAALTLIGTTLYCLIFLPHFLGSKRAHGNPGRIQRMIEKISSYPYDRNKILVAGVVLLTVVCLFFYGRVGFDSDMMNLNYMPPHLKHAEEKLSGFTSDKGTVIFVSTGTDPEAAYGSYLDTHRTLDSLRSAGLVTGYASAVDFVMPPSVQQERIGRWNDYWSGGKREEVIGRVEQSGVEHGFRADAFDGFAANLRADYAVTDYFAAGAVPAFLEDWVGVTDDGVIMLVSQVGVPAENKEQVYASFDASPDVVIVDRGYYTNRMAETVNDDFYLTLFIASVLIFLALLLSYGRIELTLMAFMPMFVSWIIILGLMAMIGIEFNIVNIILSTFIFGIGDDFSIFIMDGLLGEYKDGKRLLTAHKTAIFFSAFTIIVGLGVLVFAQHPALRSISVISILGILTVIAVSYVLQPVIFRMFITSQTRRGGFPYTLGGLLNTIYAFTYFLAGCLVLQVMIVLLLVVPVGAKKKKLWFHRAVSWATWFFLRTMVTTRRVAVNETGETFEKPAVVIANHQSFIDILVMLGLYPKLVMVTNSWVWKSPFFGRIVRYADFYHTADGYDQLAETLREKVAEGYSVVVFPEGTRSPDQKIKRFHKGAFYLAETLGLDILPVVLYGNGLVSSKRQPLYIKKGLLVSKILGRISPDDTSFGTGYAERTKRINAWFRAEYGKVYEEYNRTHNPYFYDALMKNYTYKGPVLEWYMRVKVRMEKRYEFFDRTIPRDASVVDVGCGYGALAYMLAMLSDRRRVMGIDYDDEKIAVANHNFARDERVSFAAGDASTMEMPEADVFVLNDMLHYLDFAAQDALLARCFAAVCEGGMVLVRDGDASDAERHRATEKSERWSTRILGFNKTAGELHFTDSGRIAAAADRAGFGVEVVDDGSRYSNKIYVMKRR